MEDLIKDALPKEVIEIQEALPLPEPESEGIGWGATIGLGALAIIVVAGLYKNYCRCKKK